MNELLSLEAARDRILATIQGPLPDELVPIDRALGRVIAASVTSATDLPPWDNSAMDGYAVRSTDVGGASEQEPVGLAVIGDVRAGQPPGSTVAAGTAVRIATGAPIPQGADAVVAVEQTTPIDSAGRQGQRGRDATGPLPAACLVHQAVPPGSSIRRRGDDLLAGAVVLAAGAMVTPAGIAIASGSGVAEIRAHRRPRVAVLATGDEIRPAGEPLGPASIPDANGPGLRALVVATGGEAVDLGIAPDRLEEVEGRLAAVIGDADVIIVSGGVSVGPYDVVRLAFQSIGRIDLWRVAIQPGKPFAFGLADDPGGRPTLLFGLPGNPVSSFVTFELFVRPALRLLSGHRQILRPTDRALMDRQVSKSPGRRAFLRVVADRDASGRPSRDERGRVTVRLAGGQGSHVLSSLAAAEALAVIPDDVETLPAGEEVELWWLDGP